MSASRPPKTAITLTNLSRHSQRLCNFSLLVVVPCEAFGQDHSRHSGTRDLEASVTRVILHLLTREVSSVAKLVLLLYQPEGLLGPSPKTCLERFPITVVAEERRQGVISLLPQYIR